jgi:hypothetical protein
LKALKKFSMDELLCFEFIEVQHHLSWLYLCSNDPSTCLEALQSVVLEAWPEKTPLSLAIGDFGDLHERQTQALAPKQGFPCRPEADLSPNLMS